MPELTVVIPCYNEASRLPRLFDLVRANRALDWEWLFVDDGSTDDTASLVQALVAEIPDKVALHALPANCGKGRAVREGLLRARGDLVGFVDADLAASPLDFRPFLQNDELHAGRCVIIGIRLKTHDGRVRRHLHRHLMGRVFQTLVSTVSGLNCYDTQCGFKLLSRDRARELAGHLRCDGFCFDVELLLLADRLGLRIVEYLIQWEEQGHSRVRPWHIVQMFFDIWRIRSRVDASFPPPRG